MEVPLIWYWHLLKRNTRTGGVTITDAPNEQLKTINEATTGDITLDVTNGDLRKFF